MEINCRVIYVVMTGGTHGLYIIILFFISFFVRMRMLRLRRTTFTDQTRLRMGIVAVCSSTFPTTLDPYDSFFSLFVLGLFYT